jgi:xylulokinase
VADLSLGIDVGTASTKAIAFDATGAEVASASRPYPLLTPQPGWVEQDAEQVWQGLLEALREIAARAAGHRIVALALAAQAGSIIPTDERGDPVHPMITWLDRRTETTGVDDVAVIRAKGIAPDLVVAGLGELTELWEEV